MQCIAHDMTCIKITTITTTTNFELNANVSFKSIIFRTLKFIARLGDGNELLKLKILYIVNRQNGSKVEIKRNLLKNWDSNWLNWRMKSNQHGTYAFPLSSFFRWHIFFFCFLFGLYAPVVSFVYPLRNAINTYICVLLRKIIEA